MVRLIALLIIVIPGLIAVFGFKLMRDTLFGFAITPFFESLLTLQFIVGLVLFAAGVAFIAGFILRRDRKRKRVQQRFQIEDHNK